MVLARPAGKQCRYCGLRFGPESAILILVVGGEENAETGEVIRQGVKAYICSGCWLEAFDRAMGHPNPHRVERHPEAALRPEERPIGHSGFVNLASLPTEKEIH